MLVGLPAYLLRRSDHVTDALVSLHWLRVPERIQYKIAVLAYRVLHGTVARYLGPLVCVSDVSGRRALHSDSTNRLVVPPFKLSTIGSRTFKVAAARTWNDLPEDVTSSPTMRIFRNRMESYLLCRSFLTCFRSLKLIVFPHSGFEVALLIRPLKNAD